MLPTVIKGIVHAKYHFCHYLHTHMFRVDSASILLYWHPWVYTFFLETVQISTQSQIKLWWTFCFGSPVKLVKLSPLDIVSVGHMGSDSKPQCLGAESELYIKCGVTFSTKNQYVCSTDFPQLWPWPRIYHTTLNETKTCLSLSPADEKPLYHVTSVLDINELWHAWSTLIRFCYWKVSILIKDQYQLCYCLITLVNVCKSVS